MESRHSALRMHWDHEPDSHQSFNDERRMTNDERNPKPECRKTLSGAFADFVIRILSFLRISSLVIRVCEEWFMESRHSLLRMHCDHEPTPNPSQEGNE